MKKSKTKWQAVCLSGICALALAAAPDAACADKKPKTAQRLMFDADTRKKTRKKITDDLSYGVSAGIKYLSEANLALDDATADRKTEAQAHVDLAFGARLGDAVRGFAHLEFALREKSNQNRSYGSDLRLRVKEAQLSFALTDTLTFSFGRMRFSGPLRWAMDAAGDGVHLGYKSENIGLEFAAFRDVFNDRGTYALAHVQHATPQVTMGAYGLFERSGTAQRFHAAGYLVSKRRFGTSLDLYGAAVMGDAANGHDAGFAVDVTLTRALPQYRFKPQLQFGLAAGTAGYLQPDLKSNKTRAGGQTQFQRFGTVFQPELTNLAVATGAVGLRPSRRFSVDLRAHVYAQLDASTVAPTARVSGRTTGQSRYLGHEISIVGAWRPSKKTKVEFGAGVFKPGRAYQNRNTSRRISLRMTQYF